MGQLQMYLAFSRSSFRRAAAYRFDAWTRVFSNFIFLFIWGVIWYGLYLDKNIVAGVSFQSMLSYIFVSQMLQGIHSAGTPLWEIQEKVRTGDIVMELIRPYDYPLRALFSDLGSIAFHMLTAVLPLYVLLFWWFHLQVPYTFSQWFLFIFSAILGFLIRFSIELIFGLFTFWLVETGGVEDIFYFSISLFSGSVVPLWFFPDWLETLARFLPFQGIFFVPNAIFVEKLAGPEAISAIFIQLFWVLVSFFVLRFVWRKVSQKVTVQGG
ncbi:ABC transporter permease [Tepidibacillus sp. LV47]|uniref:ABC transporter permease n=1 Tax=Tepidibacillus sp. LV47 TaxID=3398228 RepID=UPI003AAB930D